MNGDVFPKKIGTVFGNTNGVAGKRGNRNAVTNRNMAEIRIGRESGTAAARAGFFHGGGGVIGSPRFPTVCIGFEKMDTRKERDGLAILDDALSKGRVAVVEREVDGAALPVDIRDGRLRERERIEVERKAAKRNVPAVLHADAGALRIGGQEERRAAAVNGNVTQAVNAKAGAWQAMGTGGKFEDRAGRGVFEGVDPGLQGLC